MIIWFIIVIFILISIFIGLTRPKLLYFILVFMVSWNKLIIDVGFTVTVYRLIVIIFLFCLPIYFSLKQQIIRPPENIKFFIIFIGYAVIITLAVRFFIPQSYIPAFFRGEGRWVSQIVMLIVYITPVFLPLLFFKKISDIKLVVKVFVSSIFVLCVFGWLQSIMFYLYSVDLSSIFVKSLTGEYIRPMVVNMFGIDFFRMHSFAREPRNFAVIVAIAILLLFILKMMYAQKHRFINKYNLLIGFFLISLFVSLSTSGFAVLAAGLGLIVLSSFFIRSLRFKPVFNSVIAISIITLIFFIIIISSGVLSLSTVKSLILSRTIERSFMASEIFDVAALEFLSHHPLYGLFGVGIGNIHLYARDYLPVFSHSYAYNTVFIPLSGYLIIIAELGIVGLVLFSLAYLKPIFSNFQYKRLIHDNDLNKIIMSLNIFAVLVFVAYLLRREAVDYVYIILGLLFFMNYKLHAIINQFRKQKDFKFKNTNLCILL